MEEKRLMKILGVRTETRLMFCERMYFFDKNGCIHAEDGGKVGAKELCDMINNPEQVHPFPRLTNRELTICTALGARWISRDNEELKVGLWETKPHHDEDVGFYATSDEDLLAYVYGSTFSLRSGQKMELELALTRES